MLAYVMLIKKVNYKGNHREFSMTNRCQLWDADGKTSYRYNVIYGNIWRILLHIYCLHIYCYCFFDATDKICLGPRFDNFPFLVEHFSLWGAVTKTLIPSVYPLKIFSKRIIFIEDDSFFYPWSSAQMVVSLFQVIFDHSPWDLIHL